MESDEIIFHCHPRSSLHRVLPLKGGGDAGKNSSFMGNNSLPSEEE